MSLADPAPEQDTWWMNYLKGIQRRPGWSVARLARESNGQLSLNTIKRMTYGTKRRVDVSTVRLIATIVGDDPEDVVRQAVASLIVEPEPAPSQSVDPRLHGLDPNSTIVRHIMLLPVDEETRGFMLDRQREKQAERLRQEQAELAELDYFARKLGQDVAVEAYFEAREQARREQANGVD
ncbi:hypothetical protein [Rhizocola hellebori]|nr:hypothetical protein [Rhizocola hellebori]